MENKRLPQLCSDIDCTGCMACVNVCNRGALSVGKNAEGFYRPSFDRDKCIMCGLCERSCPILNPPTRYREEDIRVYACWHNNAEVRKNSSSGGAFTALAETVMERGGVVVGAAYTSDMHIEHIIIKNKSDLKKLRLSKYAQSNIGDVFVKIKEELKAGREVLFVGTACQAAGLKNFLRRDYENLTCADIICHGVPSNNLLQAYLKWIEPKTGKVTMINFRDKQKGWYDNLRVVTGIDGGVHTLKGEDDAYWVAFSHNNCLQESCYHCRAQGFPRCSDITLADFWRIGQKNPFGHKDEIENGVSMIIVNNKRAQSLINAASNRMYIEERTIEESVAGNQAGVHSSVRPASRDIFYKDLELLPFEQFRLKHMKPSMKECLVKIFRERLPFCVIKYVRLKQQK